MKMKRIISAILAAVMLVSVSVPAFAAKSCNCKNEPVIYIPGFGTPICKDLEAEEPVSLFPPASGAIAAAVPDLAVAIGGLLSGNNKLFGTFAMKGVEKMLGEARCTPDGNPLPDTGIKPDENEITLDVHKYADLVADEDIDDKYFTFLYDWRISPIDNAKLLRDYINEVKALTGHKNYSLVAHSQGNTIVATYLQLYGSKNIEKIVFLSPAFQGLSMVGSLFTKDIDVAHKGDAVEAFVKGIINYDDMENAQNQLIGAAVSLVNSYGVVDFALNWLQTVLDSQLDRIFDECLIDILGTMPGIWSFVPAEKYEQAKEIMLGNSEKYKGLIEKTDYYHYKVQTKLTQLLRNARANGTDIVIAAGYNISSIPVAPGVANHSDFLIDTKYMSIGAKCAPYGSTLGEGYRQAKKCGHSHVSPDGIIDASTAAFPEYTWFFKNNPHNAFSDGYLDFVDWALNLSGQPTVRSSQKYPQFMEASGDEIFPATAAKPEDTRSDEEVIIRSAIGLIKG